MLDEENNFGGSLVLDFRNWWRHVQAKRNSTYIWSQRFKNLRIEVQSKNT